MTSYTYDTSNRLVSVTKPDGTVVTFGYDATGARISASVTPAGGSASVVNDFYQLGHLAYQTDGNGTLLATYTDDSQGTPVSVVVGTDPTNASARYYYVYNAHGDVVNLVDASGNVVATYAYDTWGNPTSMSETIANANGWVNPYRYDGRDGVRYDASDGLYWMSVRAYDPKVGRFLSRDPLGRAPLFFADNPYVYAGNNPVSNVDPSGQRYINGAGSGSSDSSSSNTRVHATHRPSPGLGGHGPCFLKTLCVIFMTGVDITWPWAKVHADPADDASLWRKWTGALSSALAGYYLLEATDASDGVGQLHHYLRLLRLDGFHGKVVVVGHSNGAAGLFGYFAKRQQGNYSADYPISRFISLDAPVGFNAAVVAGAPGWGAVAEWAGWSYFDLPGAEFYIASHHIRGIWAYDGQDLASGPAVGPWISYATGGGDWWDMYSTHVYLALHPTGFLLQFLLGG